jgi:hypothetical protein
MTLPSGRQLAYPFPRLVTDPFGEMAVVFKDYQNKQWVDCRKGKGAYGGTWTENAVQAVSRDILVAAMPRLEAAGYPIVLHVHDEIVAEVPDGFGSEEEFLRLVTGVDAIGGTDHRTGRAVTTSKIQWEGPVDVSADEASRRHHHARITAAPCPS